MEKKPKTTDNNSNKKSGNIRRNKIVTSATSLDDLIEYYLDNIMVDKSPIPTNESSLTFLPLKDTIGGHGSNIRSKYQVNLSPIKASKVKPCPLLRSLLSRPLKPVHTICYNFYGVDPQNRSLPLGSNIHSAGPKAGHCHLQ